jgi:hypothetical protein
VRNLPATGDFHQLDAVLAFFVVLSDLCQCGDNIVARHFVVCDHVLQIGKRNRMCAREERGLKQLRQGCHL